jgi:hypothetical protein
VVPAAANARGKRVEAAERKKAAEVPRPTSVSMLAARCMSVRTMPERNGQPA